MSDNLAYLASPYYHRDPFIREQRYLAACRMTGTLMQHGEKIYSPIVHNHPVACMTELPKDWSFWREIDLLMLSNCQLLYVLKLDGWDVSTGVKAETEFAEENGIEVIYLNPPDCQNVQAPEGNRSSRGNQEDIRISDNLNELSDLCRKLNDTWWHDPITGTPLDRNKGELIALMHSELSECLEGERKSLMDAHLPHRSMAEVELADTLIRIFNYAGGFGYDLGGAFVEKLKYNAERLDHKPEHRAAGGKKF